MKIGWIIPLFLLLSSVGLSGCDGVDANAPVPAVETLERIHSGIGVEPPSVDALLEAFSDTLWYSTAHDTTDNE